MKEIIFFFFFKKSESKKSEQEYNIAQEGKELLQCWRNTQREKLPSEQEPRLTGEETVTLKKTLRISEFEIRSGGKTPRERHEHDRVCPCCGYLETIFLIPG